MKANSQPRVVDQIQDLTEQLAKDVVRKIYSDVVLDLVKGTSLEKYLKSKRTKHSSPEVFPPVDSK